MDFKSQHQSLTAHSTMNDSSALLLSFAIHRGDNRSVINRSHSLRISIPSYDIFEETEKGSCPISFVRNIVLPCITDSNNTITISLVINNDVTESTELSYSKFLEAVNKTIALRIWRDYVIQIHVWPQTQITAQPNNIFITFGTRGMSGRAKHIGECVASASVRGPDGRWVAFSRSACGITNADACGGAMPNPSLTEEVLGDDRGPVVKVEAWGLRKGANTLLGTAVTPVCELRNGEIGTCIALIRDDGRRMGYVEIRKQISTSTGVEIVLDLMVNIRPIEKEGFSVVMKETIVPSIPIAACMWMDTRRNKLAGKGISLWGIRALFSGIGRCHTNDIALKMMAMPGARNGSPGDEEWYLMES